MQTHDNRRPRQWAADIANLKTLQERRQALKQLDTATRPLVETHLKNHWARKAPGTTHADQ